MKMPTMTLMIPRLTRTNKIKISRKRMVKRKVMKQTRLIQVLSKTRTMKIMMMIVATRSMTITTTQR